MLLFANQASREDVCLRNNATEFVITDSPVPLAVFYSLLLDDSLKQAYEKITKTIDGIYPSVNFFCKHNPNYVYHSAGRHHSREQSQVIGSAMYDYVMEYYGGDVHVLPADDRLSAVLHVLRSNQEIRGI